jgi:DNA-binding SARP family transcriptional activator
MFRRLAQVDGRSESAYYYLINRGLSYEKKGDRESALRDYEAAADIKSDAIST